MAGIGKSRALLIATLLAMASAVGGYFATRGAASGTAGPSTVALRDLTWVEIRDAVAAGYTTVIVPTGGIEQNGPHMILGKHDDIVGFAARRIAADLGRTLVTPVVSFVPQSGHLKYPGTIGVRQEVFRGLLEDIAASLKGSGFKVICFIGDHGESIEAQSAVAEKLSRQWAANGVRVLNVTDYYDDRAQYQKLEAEGESRAAIGIHAGIIDTSELMSINPAGVDLTRVALRAFPWSANGASGNPERSSSGRGRQLIDMRVAAAVAQIKAQLAKPGH